MSDQEFRDTVEAWCQTNAELTLLKGKKAVAEQRRQDNPKPEVVRTLTQIQEWQATWSEITQEVNGVVGKIHAAEHILNDLERKIRKALPAGIWYILDDVAVSHRVHEHIRFAPVEEVLDGSQG